MRRTVLAALFLASGCHRDLSLDLCEHNPAYCAETDPSADGESEVSIDAEGDAEGDAVDESSVDAVELDSAARGDIAEAPDTLADDSGAEAGKIDSSAVDTAVVDSATLDSAAIDSAVIDAADASKPDSTLADTAVLDSGADTAVADSTTADTSTIADSGAADTAVDAPKDTAICSAGGYQCVGDQLQTCAAGGAAWTNVVACPAGTCSATLKRCNACTPGAVGCAAAARQECSATGTWVAKATCATPELCAASTGTTCAAPTCAIGETACSGKTARVCKASRDGWVDTVCSIGCASGACLKAIALPAQVGAHTCAILSDGTVRCWGEGFTATPTTISGIASAVQISTSYSSSAARLADGTLRWWGQLYTPTAPGYVDSPVALPIPGLSMGTSVSVGDLRVCAIQTDTSVKCYGKAPLGDGTWTDFSAVKAIPGLTGVSSISVFDLPKAGFAVVASGGLGWGTNSWGQLGDGSTVERLAPVVGFGFATQISFHSDHACALLATGGVRCAGANDIGQLGRGTTSTKELVPADVSGLTSGAKAVSAGAMHSCALMNDKTVRCWGFNEDGQLGNGTTTMSLTPVTVPGLTGVAAVACGQTFTCALLETGDVRCWGDASNGRLGNGVTTATPIVSPTPVIW